MCKLKIDVYQCGHKRRSLQVRCEYSLIRGISDLARLSCVAQNFYLCDEDNQAVDYNKYREKCELCLIRILYQANLREYGLEYEMAKDVDQMELEAQAMQEAKDSVSSPLQRQVNVSYVQLYKKLGESGRC
jgi:hypothetical protein